MKGLVVFDTSYGNTRVIAEAISQTLKESSIEVDASYLKDVKILEARDFDFLVLGSPTKFGTMSLAFKGFLGKIKSQDWANKPFAAFDTENPQNIQRKDGSAAEKIAEKLKEKQMRQLLPVFKAVVTGAKGPLQVSEIERARGYARRLAVELRK